MRLIDGKATAAKIKEEIAEEVKAIVASGGKRPHLAAVLVGHDGGSETYVKNKVLACEACGFKSSLIRFEDMSPLMLPPSVYSPTVRNIRHSIFSLGENCVPVKRVLFI